MATPVESSFGALLRRLRLAAGLTQESLAERAGVSAKAIQGLERDPNRLPRLDTVAMLADALGLGPTERAGFLATARPDSVAPGPDAARSSRLRSRPRPLTPLIGRDGVVTAVSELVRRGEHHLITLTGPGGVGKTRLALAIAARVEGDGFDGVVFVDLAPLRDHELVLPTIAQNLGMDERSTQPLAERLAASLRNQQVLLILDNIEHLLDVRDTLLALMADCPWLVVLATSRVPLRVRGEREYRIAPLELPIDDNSLSAFMQSAAVALFLDRAQAVGVDLVVDTTTAPLIAAICHRLDGLPLAIELAAAWTRLLPLPSMLDRLERRLPLLVGGSHDLPARQRTMRDTIDWSYDLLDASQQQCFRRLAVFVGGCTIEAADVMAGDASSADGVPAPTMLELLAALLDHSLMQRGGDDLAEGVEPRLMILETIREYGLEQLDANGEESEARDRHAGYYLALATSSDEAMHGPDGLVSRAHLADEHANLRAALRWLLDRGDGGHALQLASALVGFWSERGYLSEGRNWLDEALTATDDLGDNVAELRARALVGAATLAIEQASYDQAADLIDRAFAITHGSGREREHVAALNTRGVLLRAQGRYPDAVRDHEDAQNLAIRLGDRVGAAFALHGQATALSFTGDTRAYSLVEQAIDAFREIGDMRGLAEALLSAMWHAVNAGDGQRVEVTGEEAVSLFHALGDTGRMAEVLFVLGITAQFQGDAERAIERHEEGLRLRRGRGDERGTIEQLAALATIALQQRDRVRARTLLDESLAILERYDDPWNRAMSLVILAHVELAEDNLDDAESHLATSAAIYQRIGNLLYVPWCLEGLARVAAGRGDWTHAARLSGACDALRARLGSPIPPCHPEGYADTLKHVHAALGEAEFAAAHAEGSGWSAESILADPVHIRS